MAGRRDTDALHLSATPRQGSRKLPARPLVRQALDELQWLASHLRAAYPGLRIGFDLSDMSGYAYYSGARFAVYGAGSADALARGGRRPLRLE